MKKIQFYAMTLFWGLVLVNGAGCNSRDSEEMEFGAVNVGDVGVV